MLDEDKNVVSEFDDVTCIRSFGHLSSSFFFFFSFIFLGIRGILATTDYNMFLSI